MLDKINKYIKINEKNITAGQTSTGIWYCKEVKAEHPTELKNLIGEINDILNDYNQPSGGNSSRTKKKSPPIPPKKTG